MRSPAPPRRSRSGIGSGGVEFDTRVKTAIYRRVVETARAPGVAEIAAALAAPPEEIRGAYRRLFARRVLFLEGDGETIRMAPPFSGVPTQHRVRVGDRTYFANCSWDSFGIPAALHAEAEARSPKRPSCTSPSPPRSGGRTSSTPEARSSGRRKAWAPGAGSAGSRGDRSFRSTSCGAAPWPGTTPG